MPSPKPTAARNRFLAFQCLPLGRHEKRPAGAAVRALTNTTRPGHTGARRRPGCETKMGRAAASARWRTRRGPPPSLKERDAGPRPEQIGAAVRWLRSWPMVTALDRSRRFTGGSDRGPLTPPGWRWCRTERGAGGRRVASVAWHVRLAGAHRRLGEPRAASPTLRHRNQPVERCRAEVRACLNNALRWASQTSNSRSKPMPDRAIAGYRTRDGTDHVVVHRPHARGSLASLRPRGRQHARRRDADRPRRPARAGRGAGARLRRRTAGIPHRRPARRPAPQAWAALR